MATAAYYRMTSSQVSNPAAKLGLWFARWRQRARDRNALDQMSDRDLHDRGFARAELEYELRKPFWRD